MQSSNKTGLNKNEQTYTSALYRADPLRSVLSTLSLGLSQSPDNLLREESGIFSACRACTSSLSEGPVPNNVAPNGLICYQAKSS